ncbi:MAG TPA: molybdopterin synthase sulfur carrier subunit [Gammaproteobacteria bacterium]|jgi:molybdopterin synthase sulfur carrier subunit|nr:molybdopterin synthase sulfur carrier subunit [Gammaproteobacteria bacterium]
MPISVKFFASLKESLGVSETTLDDGDLQSVGDVWQRATSDAPAPTNLLCAVNHEHVDWDHPVSAGDEVAFFPPVTGG